MLQRVGETTSPPRNLYFESDTVTIGRSPENLLDLFEDETLSRYHARLTRQEGTFFVEDLTSINGTLVNGNRISGKQAIGPEDTVQLGTWRLWVQSQAPGLRRAPQVPGG